MNLVSIAGSFGALVWIFQDGHLGIASRDRSIRPYLCCCSAAYLACRWTTSAPASRIKEAYDQSGDNTAAVVEGLDARQGSFTSAAAIMVTVFSAFALARVVAVRAVAWAWPSP